MSKQRAEKTKYRVYYGVDSNAALQPEYIPQQPRRKERTAPKKSTHAKEKAQRKAEVAKYTALVVLVFCVAAMGFLIVSRNAKIYSNTQQIRELSKEKSNWEIMVNTAEKDFSTGSELNAYFDIAQNQLNLVYPEDDQIVMVVCESSKEEETASEKQESIDIYDTLLDWFSSLERRIKSWA